MIGLFAIMANLTLSAHSTANASNDRSILFSYLQDNPELNNALIAESDTTTIVGRTDQWISQAAAAPFGITLTSASANTTTPHKGTTIQEEVIVKTNPADTQNLRHGKTVYEVKPGDSLIAVASSFGISPATIVVENKMGTSTMLKPGQDLTILPIDGISYTLKEGDDLEKIAVKYKVELEDLLDINDLELPSDAQVGDNIIIPTKVSMPVAPKKFITDNSSQIKLTQANAPANLNAGALSFIWPTATRNITQGYSGRHSGLDISNSKMVDIYASEAGFVEIAGFQSNGYGNTIIINHGNGYKTRYAHASQLYVKAGEYVEKGQTIAKQGRTGRVRGATGIHLHFEVMLNGRHVNPLSYTRP